jgi:hypothetical protein
MNIDTTNDIEQFVQYPNHMQVFVELIGN